jgi:hypothetical protein
MPMVGGKKYPYTAAGKAAAKKAAQKESLSKKRKPGAGKGPIKKRDDRMTIQPVTRPKPRGR